MVWKSSFVECLADFRVQQSASGLGACLLGWKVVAVIYKSYVVFMSSAADGMPNIHTQSSRSRNFN